MDKKNKINLPIGTIVLLKGESKKLMIIGFCAVDKEDKNKIYDYIGCRYPEGVLSSDENLLFDSSQIENIYHIGMSDNEEKEFKKKLDYIISEVK